MRIAIVNDMLMAVEALRRVIITVPDYQVIWVARDGAEAVAKSAADTPDLILMDLLMPLMDGVEATRQIMKHSPCGILIVTATVSGNAPKVFEAMGHGALDAVNTPILGIQGNAEGASQLLAKINTIGKLLGKRTTKSTPKIQPVQQCLIPQAIPPLVAIGSSTGGPKALATLLAELPANFPGAIAIIQHVDVQFAPGLVEWLKQQSQLPVALAKAGDRLSRGQVLVAGTNDHLVIQSDLTLGYTPHPLDCTYRPSVDAFFESLVKYWPGKGIGVLLTGMGRDGAEGLMSLRASGWHTIAQDRASCVVYGMPKAAAELGAAVEILPMNAIASALITLVRKL